MGIALLLVSLGATIWGFDFHTVRGRQATQSSAQEVYEGESDLSVKGRGRPQNMSGFGPEWSGDAHYLWMGKVGESMNASFYIEEASQYEVSIRLTKAPDYGAFKISLNGQEILDKLDLYSTKVVATDDIPLGRFELPVGDQQLSLTLTGAHAEAKKVNQSQYLLGLDYLRVRNLSPKLDPSPESAARPTAPRDPDTRSYTALNFTASRSLLKEHCIRCHGGEKTKGKS